MNLLLHKTFTYTRQYHELEQKNYHSSILLTTSCMSRLPETNISQLLTPSFSSVTWPGQQCKNQFQSSTTQNATLNASKMNIIPQAWPLQQPSMDITALITAGQHLSSPSTFLVWKTFLACYLNNQQWQR